MDYRIEEEFLKELKDKYPKLYKTKIWAEFSPGWYPLIKDLSKEIYDLYESWGDRYETYPFVAQMKEKFGGLRYYMYYGELTEEDHKKLSEIVDRYERKSYTICEVCSEQGKNDVNQNLYYRTLCSKCRDESNARWKKINDTHNSN